MSKRSKDHDSFSHSMTDLMAGVAVTFLLIAAIFMVKAARSQEEKTTKLTAELDKRVNADEGALRELTELKARLQPNVERRELEVIYDKDRDPSLLTIVFARDRLRFAQGDCEISDNTLDEMASAFTDIFTNVCQAASSRFIQDITLEGHTDQTPFHPADRRCGVEASHARCIRKPPEQDCEAVGFANNVRLSGARAQDVFFKVRQLLGARQDLADCLETKFVVAGRGPVEPTDGGKWRDPRPPEEDERNRRVVIKVRAVARPETPSRQAAP